MLSVFSPAHLSLTPSPLSFPAQYIPITHGTGKPRGFAFVEFAEEADAKCVNARGQRW
jgi:hypothetical protein